MKKILITEKPSVAMEFAKALKINTNRKNGYLESEEWIITWCVGHLVTMSYPEKYDEKLKQWRLDTLPFVPKEWKYEIIPQVANQFNNYIDELSGMLNENLTGYKLDFSDCYDNGSYNPYSFFIVGNLLSHRTIWSTFL